MTQYSLQANALRAKAAENSAQNLASTFNQSQVSPDRDIAQKAGWNQFLTGRQPTSLQDDCEAVSNAQLSELAAPLPDAIRSAPIPGPKPIPQGALLIAATVLSQAFAAAHAQSNPTLPAAPSTSGAHGLSSARHFRMADGRSFVLDRRSDYALLQFEGENEIISLRVTPGPRGDELLKSDTDQVRLRITVLNGATVYSETDSDGIAAYDDGPAERIQPPAKPTSDLRTSLQRLVQGFSRDRGTPIALETGPGLDAFSAEAIDAARLAVESLRETDDRAQATSLRVEIASKPSASFREGQLTLRVAPEMGYAGRPSKEALRRALAVPPKK